MSPWWFLDVDGVVNALGVPKVKHGHTKQVDVTALDGDTYPIRYFPAIVDRINTLHRAGPVPGRQPDDVDQPGTMQGVDPVDDGREVPDRVRVAVQGGDVDLLGVPVLDLGHTKSVHDAVYV